MPEQKIQSHNQTEIPIINDKKNPEFANVNVTQLYYMDVIEFLDSLPKEPIFDLVVTSPPYNIGKEYEQQMPLNEYIKWQEKIIKKIYGTIVLISTMWWGPMIMAYSLFISSIASPQ